MANVSIYQPTKMVDFPLLASVNSIEGTTLHEVYDTGGSPYFSLFGHDFAYVGGTLVDGIVQVAMIDLGDTDHCADIQIEFSSGLEVNSKFGTDLKNGDFGSAVSFLLKGNDTITGSSGDDYLIGFAGNDLVNGGGGGDTLRGEFGSDILNGGAGGDDIGGGPDRDTLNGNGGADGLSGDGQNDKLNGGPGEDDLVGGTGADLLVGGTGDDDIYANGLFDFTNDGARDIVRYFSLVESGSTNATRDVVVGFIKGAGATADRIDLSPIDANPSAPGNQAFKFVSSFTAAKGEVRLVSADGSTLVQVDTDSDAAAEMSILVFGVTGMHAFDLIL